jgi:hypothetical protein
VTACIVDSAAIYIMVVKFRNTTCPPQPHLSLLRRAALSSYSNGTRSYIGERTQSAVYIVRCLWWASECFSKVLAVLCFANCQLRKHVIQLYLLVSQFAHNLGTIIFNRPHHFKNMSRKFRKMSLKAVTIKNHYILGWDDFWLFFTFSTKVPLRFVTYLPKVPKIAKKFVWPSDRLIIGHNFLGHALYKGPKFFFSQYGLHGHQKTQNFT